MKLDLHFGLDSKALFDWRVLALTAGAGVVAGGLLGLVPAVQGTRADLGSALKTGSRGSDAPGPSQVAQRAGRRADRHVARAARRGRAVPEELAADAGRGSGLRPGSDVDPVRHDAGRAFDSRRRRAADAGVCSNAFGRCPASRPSASSGRCRSSSPPASPTSRSTVAFRPLAGRRFAPTARSWTAGSSTPPAWRSWLVAPSTTATGATVSPWRSSARRWPVATGRMETRWAASSAGPIRPSPTW